jgi:hypothetical protein
MPLIRKGLRVAGDLDAWFQSGVAVDVFAEIPFATFKQALQQLRARTPRCRQRSKTFAKRPKIPPLAR